MLTRHTTYFLTFFVVNAPSVTAFLSRRSADPFLHNLVQPEAAEELGRRKVEKVLATGAEVVVSRNPGCLLQMKASMRQMGRGILALHTIELIDASIRGRWERGRPT